MLLEEAPPEGLETLLGFVRGGIEIHGALKGRARGLLVPGGELRLPEGGEGRRTAAAAVGGRDGERQRLGRIPAASEEKPAEGHVGPGVGGVEVHRRAQVGLGEGVLNLTCS